MYYYRNKMSQTPTSLPEPVVLNTKDAKVLRQLMCLSKRFQRLGLENSTACLDTTSIFNILTKIYEQTNHEMSIYLPINLTKLSELSSTQSTFSFNCRILLSITHDRLLTFGISANIPLMNFDDNKDDNMKHYGYACNTIRAIKCRLETQFPGLKVQDQTSTSFNNYSVYYYIKDMELVEAIAKEFIDTSRKQIDRVELSTEEDMFAQNENLNVMIRDVVSNWCIFNQNKRGGKSKSRASTNKVVKGKKKYV